MTHHRIRQHPANAHGYLVERAAGDAWERVGFVWPAGGQWSWATADKQQRGRAPQRQAAVDQLIKQWEEP